MFTDKGIPPRGLSTRDASRRIIDRYSLYPLSEEEARINAIPVWFAGYIEASNSTLTIEQLQDALVLKKTGGLSSDIEPGRVSVDFANRAFIAFEFELGRFSNNKINYHPESGEKAQGIEWIRSGLIHETIHYDTLFRDAGDLRDVAVNNRILASRFENSKEALTNGFTLVEIGPEKQGVVYFNDFDESMTDVIGSYIGQKLRQKTVMLYPTSSVYRNFLDWIQFSPDRLIELHRNSDLAALATDLGELSLARREMTADPVECLKTGLRVINALEGQDTSAMERYYPGFIRGVMGKTQFIR